MINIYKASAGSGKTFTLTREYIKLILGQKKDDGSYKLNTHRRNAHRSVLAITFTNKATEEMKTRIIHELAVIAGKEKGWNERSDYADYLCELFSCSDKELRLAAEKALHDILCDFSFFGVSTIDSFFQTILRAFAREAEVSGSYDLELDDKSVIAMSIDNLLQDLNHAKPSKRSTYIENWLTDYMTALIEEGKTFNIFNRSSYIHNELIDFVSDITDDDYRAHEKELLDYFSDERLFGDFKNKIFTTVRELKASTSSACKNALDEISLLDAEKIVQSNIFKPLVKWFETGFQPKELSATLRRAIDNIECAYKKAGIDSPLRAELDPYIHNALKAIDYCSEVLRTLNVISRNLYQLGLLSSIATYLDKYRQENSTILLSDTNSLISKIIGIDSDDSLSQEAPFLYERVGVWYKNYLIDEFQDTSHSQWTNIRPLIRESLAYDNDNLVIGDEKQCIYRFRNSDPSLLHNLHTEKMAHGRVNIYGDKLSENTNWRSSADVIKFNNDFFSALVHNLGFDEIYSNVRQQISPKHSAHKGHIRLKLYENQAKSDWEQEALDFMTIELRRLLCSGYKAGDIAILVRRLDEGRKVIGHLEAVKRRDPSFPSFRIVSDSSLIIGNSPAVTLIISRLRLIASTDINTDSRKKSRKEVAALINRFETVRSRGVNPSEALTLALEDSEQQSLFMEATEESQTSVDLITLIEDIIARHIPADSLRSEHQFISAFQDLVTEFVSRGHGDIRSFLRWWDESGSATSIGGASDDTALNILTVHKSKGLEFSCVILPFAHMETGKKSELSWFRIDRIQGFPKEIIPPMLPLQLSSAMVGTPFEDKYTEISTKRLLDDVNLLYVAFTRAIDELIIGMPGPSARSSSLAKDIIEALSAVWPDFENELEIGSPTKASVGGAKKEYALRPSSRLDMDIYPLSNRRAIWSKVRLEEKYYSLDNARDRGIILHDIMASIRKKEDVDRAVNDLRHVRKAKELTENDIDEIRSIIHDRVFDPRASRWFEGYTRLLSERPIALSGDHTKRPDRVVWTADGHIDVIDYKSGSQNPKKYFKQVRGYKDLLNSIGYERVRGFLYYLDSGEIVEVC